MGLREAKIKFVVEQATDLFMRQSIAEVTMKDIATEAGIGEATLYRYFSKKEQVVLECVMMLQERVNAQYFDLTKGNSGYEKLEIFYNSYVDIFKDTPEYFYFIREFDAFMYTQNPEILKEYEKGVDSFRNVFMEAYELGLKDGSINSIDSIDIFYFSTTHALMELCKKLSIQKALLTQDKTLKKAAEIECLIKIILKTIKSK